MQPLNYEPSEFFSGDTVKWVVSYPLFPATDWTLTYAFRGVSSLTVSASASGNDHSVTITPTQSATLTKGSYEWVAQATSGSEAYTVNSGRVTVKPNLMTATAGDRQSSLERTLAAIEAVLESRITADVVAYTVAGRSVTKIPIPELMQLRATIAKDLFKLKNGNDTFGKNIYVHFTKPE